MRHGCSLDEVRPGVLVPVPHQQVPVAGHLGGRLAHRDPLAAPQRPVGADDDLRVGVLEPLRDRRPRKAGEDRHLNGSRVRARKRRNRNRRAHRHEERDAVAGLDAELDERLGELSNGARRLGPGQRAPSPVLEQPDERLVVRPLPGPPVDAALSEIEPPTDEPPSPLRPVRHIANRIPPAREHEPQVLHHRSPKPLGLLDGDPVQLGVRLRPEPPHQPSQIRPLRAFRVGPPNDISHARNTRRPLIPR
jgi:hypothetical protein